MVRPTRTIFRRWLAGWLVLTLLFAQAATAAYSCPMWQRDGSTQTMTDCAEMAGMSGDPGTRTDTRTSMDAAQPNLCKAHCDAGEQSLTPLAGMDFSHGVVLLGSLAWSSSPASSCDPVSPRIHARSGAPPGSPPGAAPLFLALQVFRL